MAYLIANSTTLENARKYLAINDPDLSSVIQKYSNCDLKPHTDYYSQLIRSIVGQQLSVKAAEAIYSRFIAFFNGISPLPNEIISVPNEKLRSVGLSYAKVNYIKDLAAHVQNKSINFDNFDHISNESITTELTAVKGIGEWTAHMFLIFSMGRLDVLPISDLGIKNGVMKIYHLDHLPNPDEVREISVKYSWHPYESVASWYIWQSLNNTNS